jgi:hypothetical protein
MHDANSVAKHPHLSAVDRQQDWQETRSAAWVDAQGLVLNKALGL